MDPQDAQDTRYPKGRFPVRRTVVKSRLISPVRIGNDVVDLRHPSCRGRAPGDPFAARILADPERAWLDEAPDAASWSLRLWALWAAKETAFKALEKGPAPSRVFRPRSLVCQLNIESLDVTGLGGGAITRFSGTVARKAPGSELTGDTREPVPGPVAVEGTSDGSWLHMIGWSGGQARPVTWRLDAGVEGSGPPAGPMGMEALEAVRSAFSEEEWEGVHSVPSARARILARDRLAAALAAASRADPGPGSPAHRVSEGKDIEILTSGQRPGRTPPRIRIGGHERPELDVSLSHHGRFVAWAILLPPDLGDPPAI